MYFLSPVNSSTLLY